MSLPEPSSNEWARHLSDAFARFIATNPQPNPIVPVTDAELDAEFFDTEDAK